MLGRRRPHGGVKVVAARFRNPVSSAWYHLSAKPVYKYIHLSRLTRNIPEIQMPQEYFGMKKEGKDRSVRITLRHTPGIRIIEKSHRTKLGSSNVAVEPTKTGRRMGIIRFHVKVRLFLGKVVV